MTPAAGREAHSRGGTLLPGRAVTPPEARLSASLAGRSSFLWQGKVVPPLVGGYLSLSGGKAASLSGGESRLSFARALTPSRSSSTNAVAGHSSSTGNCCAGDPSGGRLRFEGEGALLISTRSGSRFCNAEPLLQNEVQVHKSLLKREIQVYKGYSIE